MKLQKIRTGVGRVTQITSYAGMLSCFVMVFIVAIDIIMRKAGIGRITGSNEITTYFMVWVCALGIPLLQVKDGHVWVNLLVNKFPYRFRCFWRFAILLVETLVIALLAVGAYQEVAFFLQRSTTTDILNMPKWIFAAAVLVAFVEYFLLSLIDTILIFFDGVKGEEQIAEDSWSDDQVKGI